MITSNAGTGETAPQISLIAPIACFACGFMPLESGAIWIPAATAHYAASPVALGMVASMQFLCAAFSAFLLAPFILRRKHPKVVMLAGISTVFIASLITGQLSIPLKVFAMLRLLDGVGAGLCVAVSGILASQTVRPPRSFGIMQFFQIATNACLFVVTSKLLPLLGVSAVFDFIIFGSLVALAIVSMAPVPRKISTQTKVADLAWVPGSWPRILAGGCGVTLASCAFIALITSISFFGARVGLSLASVSLLLAAGTPFTAAGSVISAFLSGRVATRILLAAGISGAAFGLIAMGVAREMDVFVVSFIFFMAFNFFTTPTLNAVVSQLDNTGRAAACTQAAQMIGLAIGPTLGAIIRSISLEALLLFSVCGLIAGVFLGGAAAGKAVNRTMQAKSA